MRQTLSVIETARAVAVKLGFEPDEIRFIPEAAPEMELNGRAYVYAGAVEPGGAVVLYGRSLIPEATVGIAAHAIVHAKAAKGAIAFPDGPPPEGVTQCSRALWRAVRSRRVERDAAAVTMLAEMARIKAETSKLPGASAWREAYRLLDKDFDESKHPRDDRGRFSESGGGDGDLPAPPDKDEREHPGKGYSKDAYVKDGVIHTSNVYDAQRALYEDREVELEQPKQVATLIQELGRVAMQMQKQGKAAPFFDLCKVTVKGTNLFCAETKGIPRVEMPQMDKAQTILFIKHLEDKGYKIEKGKEKATNLRATQNQLNGAKVALNMDKYVTTGKGPRRIIVSRSDYVLDGHHKWAAKIGLDAADNKLSNDTKLDIWRVDISITKLLKEAQAFTGGKGAKPAEQQPVAAKKDFDESKHPRDEHGRWTEGGGGGTVGEDQPAPPPDEEPTTTPEVINVGGDEWNKQTAVRLEREYQQARPALDKLAKGAVGSLVAQAEETDVDEEEGPVIPEEWEQLSNSEQSYVEEEYVKQNTDSFYQSEVDNYFEDQATDDAMSQIEYEFNKDFEHEWADEPLADFRAEFEEESGKKIPFTDEQILDALKLSFEPGHYPKIKGLDIGFDDSELQEPEGKAPPEQITMPGIEPPDYSKLLTKDMRDGIIETLTEAFKDAGEKKASDMEPPDYLKDSAEEMVGEFWAQMADSEKWDFAVNQTTIMEDYTPSKTGGGEEAAVELLHVDKLPEEYNPLGSTSGVGYKETQQMARYLSATRTLDILKERKLPVPSAATLARIDSRLWSGWKNSSTSQQGLLLQVATADELGGRLNEYTGARPYGNEKPAKTIDPEALRRDADAKYPEIGGYAGVKAYLRAKWETSQYMLDQAGIGELELYRAIGIGKEKFTEAQKAILRSMQMVGNYKKVPNLVVDRNGAASTSTNRSVCNNWGSDTDRVVLRTLVPRTAVVSVPAYGINIQSESEVVIAGTAWKSWDAWLGEAPLFSNVPMGPNGSGMGDDAPVLKAA